MCTLNTNAFFIKDFGAVFYKIGNEANEQRTKTQQSLTVVSKFRPMSFVRRNRNSRTLIFYSSNRIFICRFIGNNIF